MAPTRTVTITCLTKDEELSLPTMAGPKPASDITALCPREGIEFLWREARAQFLDQLPNHQRQHEEPILASTTLEDTVKTLWVARGKAEKAYGTKFKGKPVEIKLSRVVSRLEFIMRFGDDAMKFAPETVSYVWAAFRLVASAISQDFDSCQFLVDAVDQISDILLVCELYAKRQLSHIAELPDKPCLMADKVLEKIPPLLVLVLRFAYETRRLFIEKGRFSRAFSVLFGGAQELREIFKDAETKRDELNQTAGIAFHEAVIQLLQATQQDTNTILAYLDGLELAKEQLSMTLERMERKNEQMAGGVQQISSNVQEIMLGQLKERKQRERQDLDNKLREHLNWLQTEGVAPLDEPVKVMRENLARRYPKTCEWIIMDRRFLSWLEPPGAGHSKSFLWLSGEAGFGKSILMSYVMDYLESEWAKARSDDRPVILRFFCKLGSDASQKGDRVIAHLLCQLLHHAEQGDIWETKQGCAELVKKLISERTSSEAMIHSNRTPLFCGLARAFKRRVFVLIDGLDECVDRTNGFLDFLGQITESSSNIRLLVSSRPWSDIHSAFANFRPARIDVEQESTEKDVEAYIAGSLRTISRFDQSKRRRGVAQIAKKAAGMFRYANLAVEGLKSAAALRKPFKQLLDDLPDGLTHLYEQELLALEPAKREILMVALRWLVCGEGPISATLIADDLEGKYLDDSTESEDDDTDDGNGDIPDLDLDHNHSLPPNPQAESESCSASSTGEELERDSIRHLRSAGRNFIRIDNNGIITLQHTSVRDYIISKGENAGRRDGEALCARCQDPIGSLSLVEAGPKRGHLILAVRCLKLLNCPAFQREFLPRSILEEHRKELLALGAVKPDACHTKDPGEPGSDTGCVCESYKLPDDPQSPAEPWLSPRLRTSSGNTTHLGSSHDHRYELSRWHYHVRAAERLWPVDERNTEDWLDLDEQIGKFLSSTGAFPTWQRKVRRVHGFRFERPIHVLARYGLTHYIRRYLDSGGEIDVQNAERHTPLQLACSDERGHVAMPLLVEHGAAVNRRNQDGKPWVLPPIFLLIESRGPVELVQYLLDHGADTWKEGHGYLDTALRTAIWARHFDAVKFFLERGGPDLTDGRPENREALNFALHYVQDIPEELIELFLSKGADVNHRGRFSKFPLGRAVEGRTLGVVRTLLDTGAKVDAEDVRTGETPLHTAVQRRDETMVDLLLERGCSVVSKDKKGRNAIWYATSSATVLEAVLNATETTPDIKGAVQQPDEDGRTPLHACATFGCARSARLILDAGDRQTLMSQVDRDGKTPLHLAAERGDADVVEALLVHGVGTLPAGCTGHSVIELALRKWDRCPTMSNVGRKRTLELLLDHITPVPESLRPELLFFAVESGSLSLRQRLVEIDSHLTRLKDRHGWTPLMLAMQNRDHGIIQALRAFDRADELDSRTASTTAQDDCRPSGWGALPWNLTSSPDNLELLKTCKHRRASAPLPSNHPIPFGVPRYYWELEIVEAMETSVGIGICAECRCDYFSPGWYYTTRKIWIYRGQDGRVLATRGTFISTGLYNKPNLKLCSFSGPKFTQGDTVGCGVDFVKGVIFFTKNGVLLGKHLAFGQHLPASWTTRASTSQYLIIAKRLWTGDAVEELPHCRLFPVVVVSGRTMWIKANFGTEPSKPFKYDPSRYGTETEPQTNGVELSVDA